MRDRMARSASLLAAFALVTTTAFAGVAPAPMGEGTTVEICSSPALAIPDNLPAGVVDSINWGVGLTIVDLDVYINATHTWVGDLRFTLQHVPSGTTAVLIDRPGVPASTFGCSGNDYDVTVDDEGPDTAIESQCSNLPAISGRAPGGDPPNTSLLAAFDGESTSGVWTLTVVDNAAGDTGSLAQWCLQATVIGEAPDIDVDPLSLSATQPADTVTQQPMTIGNLGEADLEWSIFEDASGHPAGVDWSDDFDSYATGSQLHGQGGWKGWFNDPTAGALTSGAQARSAPNSAAIAGASDLVHEYSGYTSGLWTFTAWQFVPAEFTGQSYFILLNTYNDGGVGLNWSAQVMFDGAANQVVNDGGVSGGSLPLVRGQWVELRVEINLDSNNGAFYYNNQLLYSGTWTGQVSGGGALNIGAVDLFANGASTVYYDDMSLVGVPVACDDPEDIPWASVSPTNGTTAPGGSSPVQVTFDSTGLAPGTYLASLCVTSNDPDAGPGNGTSLVIVPLELEVTEPQDAAITLAKTVGVNPGECAAGSNILVPPGTTVYYCYTVTNIGDVTLNSHDLVDSELGVLLNAFAYALLPGNSAFLVVPAVITVTTTNTATWTAAQSSTGGAQAVAVGTATVEILEPPIIQEIPTLGDAGVALFVLTLAGLGLRSLRRRHV